MTVPYQRGNERDYGEVKTPDEALKGLDYPVVLDRAKIMEMVREHPSFVLVGETGSGKTTCLPIMLLELKEELGLKGKIAITQPRRVATRSVANRVADLMGCEVGQEVGFQYRFEDHTSEGTELNFMTDGILLRKMQSDPLLQEYSIVMIDEAHERSLNIDLCLGLLRDANEKRVEAGIEPIRIAVTSATIEHEKFAEYFRNGDVGNSIEVPGEMYPVQVSYEAQTPRDFMQVGATKVKQIIESGAPGDILVFMPGKEEIDKTIKTIENIIGVSSVEIIRLHADMSPEDQDRIFYPNGKRKIIVSTNIAETSVTIPSVRHVVDSGLIKQIEFDSETGIEQLVLRPHALSGLEQRKGRAGRVVAGKCYRLFTEDSLSERMPYQVPELQRSELAHVVLTMKKIGIADVEDFDFIDPPDRASIQQAIETLKTLGALDQHGDLTETGDLMAELGLEPKLGRMVIEAYRHNCVEDVCTVAAFLGGKKVFNRPKDKEFEADRCHASFKDNDSDFVSCLNVWDAYVQSGFSIQWARENFLNSRVLDEAKKVRFELLRILRRNGIVVNGYVNGGTHAHDKVTIGKAVTAGLIGSLMERSARYSFRSVNGKESGIFVHPSSTTFAHSSSFGALLVYANIFKNPQGKIYASNCQLVEPEWIPEVAPQFVEESLGPGSHYDRSTDSVVNDITLRLKGSHNDIVVGNRQETMTGVGATRVFSGALVRGEVNLPETLARQIDENKLEISRLNDLWRRAEGKIE